MKLRSLLLAAFLALPLASYAQVEFTATIAPPPLPVYEQPPCPVAGYIWTPGYWGWGSGGYYWVPGVWVAPPSIGLLWTPGWWGWRGGTYVFNQGYWGPTVGFYGGINYGFGYTGNGYWGGRWHGSTFEYNTAVTRVNKTVIHNTYVNNSFTRNVTNNRTSFNGGNGGIKAEPTAEQKAAAQNAKKVGPTSEQLSRREAASKDPQLQASNNKGHPNQDAIRSFNKTHGAALGQGGHQVGAAGGAGAENKTGNANEHAGAGAGAGKGANEPGNMSQRKEGAEGGAGAQAGKGENNVGERNHQGERTGNAGAGRVTGNEHTANNEHQRNTERMGENQTRMHTGQKTANTGSTLGPRGRTMNQMQHNQQMHNAQMGGRPPMQGGGNRQPRGQPQHQAKKKPNER